MEGLKVTATAYTDAGPAHGEAGSGTAAAQMATIELKCPKFSPEIQLHLTSDSTLPAAITMKYTLDGWKPPRRSPCPRARRRTTRSST